MKEYPKELEKDMVKALGKLIGYNCIHMKSEDFENFMDNLESFTTNNGLFEIFDEAMSVAIMGLKNALKEVLNDILW